MFCRSGERCGRANFWSGAQENLFHADAHAAPKKEKHDGDKKEIADGNTVAECVRFGVAQKKEESIPGGRIAIAHAKEGEDLSNAVSDLVITTSKEKAIPNARTVRISGRIDISSSKPAGISAASAFAITETPRAERDIVAESN